MGGILGGVFEARRDPPGRGGPGAGPGGVSHFRGYLITLPVGTDEDTFLGRVRTPPGTGQDPPRDPPWGGTPGTPQKDPPWDPPISYIRRSGTDQDYTVVERGPERPASVTASSNDMSVAHELIMSGVSDSER